MIATSTRLADTERTKTTAAISRGAQTTGTTAVLVGSGAGADALSVAFLAGRLQVPVLLTPPKTLSNAAATALTRAGVRSVHLIGGTSVIRQHVEDLLGWSSYGSDNTTRRAGRDSPSINLAVLAAGAVTAATTEAFVVRACGSIDDDDDDGVAAGATSSSNGVPVLLMDQALPAGWAAAVKASGITKVTVPGGMAAVPGSVETALQSAGSTLGTRLTGDDSPATAVAIAAAALTGDGSSDASVGLARGDVRADALAAAPSAGTKKSPLLLTASPIALGTAATGFLTQHEAALTTGAVFGSTSAIARSVVAAAISATA